MTFKTLSLAAATTAIVALSLPAFAAGEAPLNVDKTAAAEAGPVAQLALAQDLYAYGVANKDALSVLAAARMAGSVEVAEAEMPKTTEAIEGATQSDAAGTKDGPVDAATMLATAKELGAGDETIMGMIADAETEGSRGRIGGPKRSLSRLPAGYYDLFKIPFKGGRLAEVAILGDGDADLDALVTDEYGNTACVDTSSSDKLYCSFTPINDGYFFVKVSNEGRVRNSYYLLTN